MAGDDPRDRRSGALAQREHDRQDRPEGAELTGPAIGTVALTTAGPGAGFLTCAAFYPAGLAMFWRVRHAVHTPTRPLDRPGILAPVVEGLSYVRHQAPIGTLLVLVGLHRSLAMASIGILPAVATANLRGSAGACGLLLAAFGLGSVFGPLEMMWLDSQVFAVPVLVVAGISSGLPIVSLGLVRQMDVDLASSVVAGAAQAVFMAGIFSTSQGASNDTVRGRVASVQLWLTTGAMGFASIGWGALAASIAPGVVLAIPGAAFVIATRSVMQAATRRDRSGGVDKGQRGL